MDNNTHENDLHFDYIYNLMKSDFPAFSALVNSIDKERAEIILNRIPIVDFKDAANAAVEIYKNNLDHNKELLEKHLSNRQLIYQSLQTVLNRSELTFEEECQIIEYMVMLDERESEEIKNDSYNTKDTTHTAFRFLYNVIGIIFGVTIGLALGRSYSSNRHN